MKLPGELTKPLQQGGKQVCSYPWGACGGSHGEDNERCFP